MGGWQAPNGEMKNTSCSSQYCAEGGNIVNNVDGSLSCVGEEDGVEACLVSLHTHTFLMESAYLLRVSGRFDTPPPGFSHLPLETPASAATE
jgi:hypothetical protein